MNVLERHGLLGKTEVLEELRRLRAKVGTAR
jgi:hypothetical protein